MSLANLKVTKAESGATLELKHPGTEEVIKGSTITVRGQDSKLYRDRQREKQQAALDRMSKGKKAARLNAKELEDSTTEDLIAMILSWEGIDVGTGPLECTYENAKVVLTMPEVAFIREQLQEFVADRSNFM